MKKALDIDDRRPEYDLKSLPVRRFGPSRKNFGGSVVRLEPESFPTADAVNEALRILIRITKENKPTPRGPGGRTYITRRLTSACMGLK